MYNLVTMHDPFLYLEQNNYVFLWYFIFRKDYNTKSGEGLVVNVMGLMIVLFAMGVLFMLSKFEKKKHP